MRTYHIEYMEHSAAEVKGVNVVADSKEEAYDRAVYEILSGTPYAAWVASVTYRNGGFHRFNTFAGKPF